MSISPRALVVWGTLCVIWGTTWLAIKIGLEDLPPFTFASVRFAVSALALAAVILARRTPLPASGAQWAVIGYLGVLQVGLPFGLTFWASQFIPSSLTAILFSIHPLFVIILAHLFVPAEPLRAGRVLGAVCGVAGIAAIFSRQAGYGRASLAGSLAVIGAALCGAVANIIAKRNERRLDAVANTTLQMTIGALSLGAVACWVEEPLEVRFTPRAWGALLYLALVGSAAGFVLFYWLIKRVDITFASFIPIVNTFVAVLLGWAVLDERLGWHTAAGGALILAGVVLVALKPRRGGREPERSRARAAG